jgi:hypothetical protein
MALLVSSRGETNRRGLAPAVQRGATLRSDRNGTLAKWGLTEQSEKAREYHSPALANGKTCIDCHKGITHRLPEGIEPDYEP